MLLPHVMRFNLPARPREFAAIARLLGEDVSQLSEAQAAERAIVAVDRLREDIGVPGRLREFGAKETQLRGFAEKAASIKRILRVNPRTVTVEEVEGIFKEAL